MSGKIIGYTTGVFDLFHIGHLNILENARLQCDILIVGVTTDELAKANKKRVPIIPYQERVRILESLRCVDRVVAQKDMNKFGAWERYNFHKMFVGSDWKGTESWNRYEEQFSSVGVEIVYLPYTNTTSSTIIREVLNERLRELKNEI